MKKILLIFLLIPFLCSCSYSAKPCANDLWKIHSSQYVSGKNDCVDKAVNYCNILLKNGYSANVIVGETRIGTYPLHAWVVVDKIWIDPTWNDTYGHKAWFKFRTGVTKQEVRNYKGIIETYDIRNLTFDLIVLGIKHGE